MNVIVADGAPLIRSRLAQVVGRLHGVSRITLTRDVPETMRALRVDRPAVALLDLFLPGGTALGVLANLPERERPGLIIVLTNWADSDLQAQCLCAGAQHVFSKNTGFLQAVAVLDAYSKLPSVEGKETEHRPR